MSDELNVAIVDYRCGNTRSVERSLARAGIAPNITAEPDEIMKADGLVLPGVGAFGPAIESLMETGAAAAIRHYIESGKPVLAICLGMQLLADESGEGGHHRGLGVVSGRVRLLHHQTEDAARPKVPHIAWNEIEPQGDTAAWSSTVLDQLQGAQMYFLHSYVVEPSRTEDWLAATDYAGDLFCSAFRHDNVFGVQFHPELSADAGQQLFENFAAIMRAAKSA